MARKKPKPKLHPLLSFAYSTRALNLQHAIVSLLPPSQSTCICEGSGCVICCGAHALLRPSDPITYRQLVTRAVVVAPVGVEGRQRPVVDLVRQVSQHEIVNKTMALVLAGYRPYDNLLCRSCDQMSLTSLSSKILCSSDWCLLLERVGDSVMEFILRHYSIFVPPSKSGSKAFIQVTGIPVTKSLRYSKASSLGSTGQKKRTRVEIAKSADSQPCAQNGGKKRKRDEFANNNEENSNCSVEKKRNRRRLYSWQRRKQQTKDSQISKDDFERTFQNEIIGSNINIMPKSQPAKEKCPCFYCFVLHSSRKIPIHSQIQRRYIFYSKSSTQSIFPKNHILNQLKANDSGALSLMKRIFGNRDSYSNFMQSTSCGDSARSRSNCLHHSFVALFKSLIRNAQRCNHRRLLHRHCFVRHKVQNESLPLTGTQRNVNKVRNESLPLTDTQRNVNKESLPLSLSCTNRTSDRITANSNLNSNSNLYSAESFCEHQQVVAFIFATLRSIVPQSLLGNKESWRALMKNIWSFVKLGRYENLTLEDCLIGLRVSQFEFLLKLESSSCSCKAKRKLPENKKSVLIENLLNTWIYWLFAHVILPVMRSCFYVTERETRRNDVFYYKKRIWMKIVKGTITCLKEKTLRVLDRTYLKKVLAKRRKVLTKMSFGFSKVRFLPKGDILRPLANLKKPSKVNFLSKKLNKKQVFSYQPVNSCLYELSIVLKKIKNENPNLLGSSVFDYNDAYQKLYNFISEMKCCNVFMPKVYIVVADVKKAFDSIDQDMLLRIIKDIIGNEEYSLGKYTHILMGKNRLNPIYKGSFGCINSNFSVQLSSNSGVFIDQASYQNIKKQLFYDLLFQHVKHNILHIGGKFYEQKVGIAQGSILSTLLCSFYFGHLEETLIWPFLKKLEGNENESAPHSLLMRYLDDFIFVTTSEKQAMGFLERVKRGFGDYNCFMNDAKYGWNFEVNRGGFVNRRYIGEDGVEFIPWSGLLVNCNTVEIQADYTRYWGINMRSTITVNKNDKQSDLLRERLCGYMLPKCHMIFYDMKINSPATVRLNLYQAFLICAMKFHCYTCEINDPIPSKETLSIIQTTFSYMDTLLCKRTKEMKTSFGVHPEFLIKKNETVWLGISAYIRILKRKQLRYKELLHLLRENLAKCDISVHPSNDLLYAVNDSHSSMFWKIKF